ncbi:MAG: pectinesterase family protein [Bacteroidales bacterium]
MRIILPILMILISNTIYSVNIDITVALDGSGDFSSIQEAIESIRSYTPEPKTIFIKSGTYKEKITIPADKCDITIIGESAESTVITWDDHAKKNDMGTFKSYTMIVYGNRITLENLTIENAAPEVAQAVALHIEGNHFVAIKCRLLGNQDTLFTGNQYSQQYYHQCYIEGTTDFIFGPATAWFERCNIHSKRNSYITAASTSKDQKFGYIFNQCTLTANEGINKVYLGRPWRKDASTIFINSHLGNHIRAIGWDNWRNPENEKSARYAEYNSTGPGANPRERAIWSKQLTKKESKQITLESIFPEWNTPRLINNRRSYN